RRAVVRSRGDAFRAALDDVTLRSVLLDAEAERLAPEVRLVVPLAARLEHHVAAERTHRAQLRTGDQARGLRERGSLRADQLARGDIGDRGHRTDRQRA